MRSKALPPSSQTTLAILLGASAWPHFPIFQSSDAFKHAAQSMRSYLLDPQTFHLPPENLLDLFDADQSADDLDQEIGRFLESRVLTLKAADTAALDLLIYFVGHGGFAGNDADFFMAIRRARMGNLRASGMQVQSLAETLTDKARHLRRILILDCCFASASFKAFQATPDQVALEKVRLAFETKGGTPGRGIPSRGTALLCSSDHKTPSLLLPDERSTMFSSALLESLSVGIANGHDYLSLREIKERAADLLHDLPAKNAPRPVVLSPDQSEGDIADIPFFPNPAASEEIDMINNLTINTPLTELYSSDYIKWIQQRIILMSSFHLIAAMCIFAALTILRKAPIFSVINFLLINFCGASAYLVAMSFVMLALTNVIEGIRKTRLANWSFVTYLAGICFLWSIESRLLGGTMQGGIIGDLFVLPLLLIPNVLRHIIIISTVLVLLFFAGRHLYRQRNATALYHDTR